MKTNKLYLWIITILFSFALMVASCKKKEQEPNPQPVEQQKTEDGQPVSDNSDAKAENDQAITDINDIISADQKLSGKSTAGAPASGVCGATLDTTGIYNGSVTINYNGTTCFNRTRTGKILLHIKNYSAGKRWKDQGTVIGVQYDGYKVTRASDQASIQLDGFQDLTNVSGGNWLDVINNPLVHTVTGTNLKVTFKDGKSAIYNINRKLTYSYMNNVLTCKAEGIGQSGGLTQLENFGTTRNGEAFTSQVNSPIIWNNTCGAAIISGQVDIKVASKAFALECLYGVDVNGNSVTVGANQCPYGWKMSWTVNGNGKSAVFAYK
jgi:hypothetical protein